MVAAAAAGVDVSVGAVAANVAAVTSGCDVSQEPWLHAVAANVALLVKVLERFGDCVDVFVSVVSVLAAAALRGDGVGIGMDKSSLVCAVYQASLRAVPALDEDRRALRAELVRSACVDWTGEL